MAQTHKLIDAIKTVSLRPEWQINTIQDCQATAHKKGNKLEVEQKVEVLMKSNGAVRDCNDILWLRAF